MVKKLKKIKETPIVYRKLGRELAAGIAHWNDHSGETTIEIDSRLTGKELLDTLIHEILHLQNPSWSEKKINKHSREITEIIWSQGFRKTELK